MVMVISALPNFNIILRAPLEMELYLYKILFFLGEQTKIAVESFTDLNVQVQYKMLVGIKGNDDEQKRSAFFNRKQHSYISA